MKHYYQNVKLAEKRGTLASTPQGLSFETEGLGFLGGGTNTWAWSSIKKPYFSDTTCAIHAVKLVFKEGDDPIFLMFPNRQDFERMEQDVVDFGHLSPSPLKLTGTLWGGH